MVSSYSDVFDILTTYFEAVPVLSWESLGAIFLPDSQIWYWKDRKDSPNQGDLDWYTGPRPIPGNDHAFLVGTVWQMGVNAETYIFTSEIIAMAFVSEMQKFND